MLQVKSLTFNPFGVNTYLLCANNGDCAIIDPSCYDPQEKLDLKAFIEKEGLRPRMVLITHTHIDHILGASFIMDTYGVPMGIHPAGRIFLENATDFGLSYGFKLEKVPEEGFLLEDGQVLSIDNQLIKVLYTPGHADGSVCFWSETNKFVVVGDVLFNGSIGRTDLPTGHFDTLMKSIQHKLMVMPDETIVYPGHGPATTIGYERNTNPFLKGY